MNQRQNIPSDNNLLLYFKLTDGYLNLSPSDILSVVYLAAFCNQYDPECKGWYACTSINRAKYLLADLNITEVKRMVKRITENGYHIIKIENDIVWLNSDFIKANSTTLSHADDIHDVLVIAIPRDFIRATVYQMPPSLRVLVGFWILSLQFLNPYYNLLTDDVLRDTLPPPIPVLKSELCSFLEVSQDIFEILEIPVVTNYCDPYIKYSLIQVRPSKINSERYGMSLPDKLLASYCDPYRYVYTAYDECLNTPSVLDW